jgi:hypothetical protein
VKRGAKFYEEKLQDVKVALVPIRKIAKQTGFCERSVGKYLKNGISKLMGMDVNPGSKLGVAIQELVLTQVYGVVSKDCHPPIQATSLECRPDFCEQYSNGGSDDVE